jgi:outer membrane protein assembly factor BamA
MKTTNKASLHFIIREGYRVKIKRIYIYGNTAYTGPSGSSRP